MLSAASRLGVVTLPWESNRSHGNSGRSAFCTRRVEWHAREMGRWNLEPSPSCQRLLKLCVRMAVSKPGASAPRLIEISRHALASG
jgi:hypothetical protein